MTKIEIIDEMINGIFDIEYNKVDDEIIIIDTDTGIKFAILFNDIQLAVQKAIVLRKRYKIK